MADFIEPRLVSSYLVKQCSGSEAPLSDLPLYTVIAANSGPCGMTTVPEPYCTTRRLVSREAGAPFTEIRSRKLATTFEGRTFSRKSHASGDAKLTEPPASGSPSPVT